MKKIELIGMCLLISTITLFAKDRITKDTNVLPANSKEFLNRHFRNIQVSHIKVDKGLWKTESYDVILTNGINVEFNSSGNWKEVEGKQTAVPAGIVPDVIQTYIQKHFPEHAVVSIEKERREYDLKLDNDIDLTFDLSGNLKEID